MTTRRITYGQAKLAPTWDEDAEVIVRYSMIDCPVIRSSDFFDVVLLPDGHHKAVPR